MTPAQMRCPKRSQTQSDFWWMEPFTTLIREAPGLETRGSTVHYLKGICIVWFGGATSEDDGKGRGGQVQGRHVRTTRQ